MAECRVQERFIKRVAAHDAVEGDGSRGGQLGRDGHEVGVNELDRVRSAETFSLLPRDVWCTPRCIDGDAWVMPRSSSS